MIHDPKQAFITSIEETYGRQLRRFLAARLRNAAADMPDLMQEIYLRLLRIEDYETIRNPQAYLHTVASHVLQQHALKQASNAQAVSAIKEDVNWEPIKSVDPASLIEAEQAFEAIDRSLQALSPRAYATLILSRCHGLSLQDIGDHLGVSRDQVKKYLTRALIHVRHHWQQIDKDQP